jgi:hypothetical protein
MPSEEIEKFRIIESRKNYEAADVWLRNFKMASWDEVRTFIRSYLPPGDEMLRLLQDARAWDKQGLTPDEVTDTESGHLEDDLSLGMANFRSTLDSLSLVGSTIRPTGYTESLSWNILSPDFFLEPFTERNTSGGFLTITGRPRMGKSGVACLYSQMWLQKFPGTEVLTNIPLEKAIPGMRPVTDIYALLQAVAEALIAKRVWLWQYDEPSLSGWMRSDAQSGRSKNLERFARIIPKLGGSFIYIEQRIEGVPTTISDFSQSHIHCTNPGSVFADLPGKRGPINHVPKPRMITYRTGEAGFFEIPPDFPWNDLFMALKFDPKTNTMESTDQGSQGERIQRFLASLEAADKPAVLDAVCLKCGHAWKRRGKDPPRQCPTCRTYDPLGLKAAADNPTLPSQDPGEVPSLIGT